MYPEEFFGFPCSAPPGLDNLVVLLPASGRIHFHPETFSSNDTFIQKWFRPKPVSSLNPKHLNTSTPEHLNTQTPKHRNTSIPEHPNPKLSPFGFQQAFMWSIASRRPAMLHMKVCWQRLTSFISRLFLGSESGGIDTSFSSCCASIYPAVLRTSDALLGGCLVQHLASPTWTLCPF